MYIEISNSGSGKTERLCEDIYNLYKQNIDKKFIIISNDMKSSSYTKTRLLEYFNINSEDDICYHLFGKNIIFKTIYQCTYSDYSSYVENGYFIFLDDMDIDKHYPSNIINNMQLLLSQIIYHQISYLNTYVYLTNNQSKVIEYLKSEYKEELSYSKIRLRKDKIKDII